MRDLSRLHQFGKKVLPGIILGYELIAERIWKGDVLIADLKDLEKLDASEIQSRRINAKEALISQTEDELIFPVGRWYSKIIRKRLRIPRTPLRREPTVRSENLSGEIQGELEAEPRDDAEAWNDFWSFQGDFIYRHNEPQVQLYVLKKETFPVPLKYIDVARSSRTDLDAMQEKRIDDHWNIDENRSLSDSWKGFTKFTFLKKNLQRHIWGPGMD